MEPVSDQIRPLFRAFHVERNQQGWVRALPRVRFNIMNTINKSTGFCPFQLCLGQTPRMIPPLLPSGPREPGEPEEVTAPAIAARTIVERLQHDV